MCDIDFVAAWSVWWHNNEGIKQSTYGGNLFEHFHFIKCGTYAFYKWEKTTIPLHENLLIWGKTIKWKNVMNQQTKELNNTSIFLKNIVWMSWRWTKRKVGCDGMSKFFGVYMREGGTWWSGKEFFWVFWCWQ